MTDDDTDPPYQDYLRDLSRQGLIDLVEACELLNIDKHYRERVPPGQLVYMTVPQNRAALAAYTAVEDALHVRGIALDWSNHPAELIARTVRDTLLTAATWLPAEDAQMLLDTANAVLNWRPKGYTCPVCQHEPCGGDCPMRRIEVRYSIDGPSPPAS